MAIDFATITSVQNPQIKSAAKLRTRKGRRQAGKIIIDGWREVSRALQAGVKAGQVFVTTAWRKQATRNSLSQIASIDADLFEASDAAFARIAFGDRAEGIVAIADTPRVDLEQLRLPRNPLIAVVEGIEKPGNLGAIVRSADGAGLDAVLVADTRTDIYNPNAIRASLGTVFSLPVAEASSQRILSWLTEQRIQVFAARVDGSEHYHTIDFTQPSCLVLGSEAEGLTSAWKDASIRAIQLPMLGVADSLNVAATAAILFYEARRQRGAKRAKRFVVRSANERGGRLKTDKENCMSNPISTELLAEIRAWKPILLGLDEAEIRNKPTPDRWSIAEVIGHLIDSACNNHQRFVRAQECDALTFPRYDRNAWVACGLYHEFDWSSLVSLWFAYNRFLAHLIDNTPAPQLATPCTITPSETCTLQFLVEDYLTHLRHHLTKIQERIA